jgi:hypothetical protein
MAFTYTESQKAEIRALYATGQIPEAYRRAADIAQYQRDAFGTRLSPDEQSAIIWLRGAAEVNEGRGAYSDFIRSYTATQFRLRQGPDAASDLDARIQTASNEIARLVLLRDILGNSSKGELPSIERIAESDAAPVAERLFNNDLGGWAGNPLFVALGVTTPFKDNIIGTAGNAYNAVAMLASLPSLSTLVGAAFASLADNGIAVSLDTVRYIGNETTRFLDKAYGGTLSTVTGVNALVSGFFSASVGLVTGAESDAVGENGEPVSIYHAGGGNDIISAAQFRSQIIDGGTGLDGATYAHFTAPIVITLNAIASAVPFTALVERGTTKQFLFDIETITGTNFDDRLVLRDISQVRDGLRIEGGAGIDTINVSMASEAVQIDVQAGTLTFNGREITIDSFEQIQGSRFNDTIVGSAGNDLIETGGGQDVIQLAEGADTLIVTIDGDQNGPIVIDDGDADDQLFVRIGESSIRISSLFRAGDPNDGETYVFLNSLLYRLDVYSITYTGPDPDNIYGTSYDYLIAYENQDIYQYPDDGQGFHINYLRSPVGNYNPNPQNRYNLEGNYNESLNRISLNIEFNSVKFDITINNFSIGDFGINLIQSPDLQPPGSLPGGSVENFYINAINTHNNLTSILHQSFDSDAPNLQNDAAFPDLIPLFIPESAPPLTSSLIPVSTSVEQNGTDNDDILTGSVRNDIIIAGAGDDTINGGDGNDSLFGDQGSDWIVAGGGDDLIFAGNGWDTIILDDGGNDTVRFGQGSGRDYVTSFLSGDTIEVTANLATSWEDLLQHSSIYQDGTSTVVEFDNGSELLIFTHTSISDITRDSFYFI